MSSQTLKIQSSQFDTSPLPARMKYESFRESMGVVFDVSKPISKKGDFFARLSSYHFGEFMLVRCNTRGQVFTRTPQMIARDGIDHFFVQLFLHGHTRTNRDIIGSKDQILILDTAQPWQAINNDFDNLTLIIPRRHLLTKLPTGSHYHGHTIKLTHPMGRILGEFILSIYQTAQQLTYTEAAALMSPCTDLTVTALTHSVGGFYSSPQNEFVYDNALYLRVKQYIEMNYIDPHFSPESIQKALGISRAHLYRIFSESGGIATYIRNRRLKLAFKKLASPSLQQPPSVKEVAFTVGFTSEAAFSRAFKQYFSLNPKEARDMADYNQVRTTVTPETPKERIWESWLRDL